MKATTLPRALLLVLALLTAPIAANAQSWSVGLSIGIAPPAMPVYVQPPCPALGYIWTPGYWAYDPDNGYYWVPGTWVLAPAPGLLWTPGYWGFETGFYSWHPGYWGPRVGFYGGINYGYGYFGTGFVGGYWSHGAYYYNREVTNVTRISVTNVYNQTVVNAQAASGRVSFNGGPGGVRARATADEMAVARGVRYQATAEQLHHDSAAHEMPSLRASVNHGRPQVAATATPGVFAGSTAVSAAREPATRPAAHSAPAGQYAQRGPAQAPAPYRQPERQYVPAPSQAPANAAVVRGGPPPAREPAREVAREPAHENAAGARHEQRRD